MRYLFLIALIITLSLPMPVHASDAELYNAALVAYALGGHSYILHGERWVYRDSSIRVTYTALNGVNPTVTTKTVVVRCGGVAVGKWVNGVEVVLKPSGCWDTLHTLASGIEGK